MVNIERTLQIDYYTEDSRKRKSEHCQCLSLACQGKYLEVLRSIKHQVNIKKHLKLTEKSFLCNAYHKRKNVNNNCLYSITSSCGKEYQRVLVEP